MNIVFLTTDDPLYLPAFFDQVLSVYAEQTKAVYYVPPLYKKQTSWQAARRYYQTFGLEGIRGLVPRILWAKLNKQSIATVCAKWHVTNETIASVNAPAFLAHLRELDTQVIVSVSCPQIFKKPLIELPSLGCLNIHGAILPQYRGVMPSFWMLAHGEKQAGVSIYFVNEKIDAGDLCGQRVFAIHADDTLDSFLRRSKRIAAELAIEVLQNLEQDTIMRTPLNLAEGSYFSWPDKDAVRRFRAQGRKLW